MRPANLPSFLSQLPSHRITLVLRPPFTSKHDRVSSDFFSTERVIISNGSYDNVTLPIHCGRRLLEQQVVDGGGGNRRPEGGGGVACFDVRPETLPGFLGRGYGVPDVIGVFY